MKKISIAISLCLISFLLVSSPLIAQTSHPSESSEVLQVVEEMPEYPGGMEACMKFLGENLKYPESAKTAHKEGSVFIGMVINKEGQVTDVKVLKGFDKACEEEAMRVVNMMPDWKPGKQRGKAVNVAFTIPIKFKLPAKEHLPEPIILDRTETLDHDVPVEPAPKEPEVVEMWTVIKEVPQFPGGEKKLFKFIADNVQYPPQAKADKKEGTAYIGYVIQKTGAVKDIKVLRSSGTQSLDDEAMRVIKLMPKWTPGKERGKPVEVNYTMPIKFKLDNQLPKPVTPPTARPLSIDENGNLTEKETIIEEIVEETEIVEEEEAKPDDDGCFRIVEQMPEFPGGQDALFEFLSKKIAYPKQAIVENIQGTVYVSYIVEKDGQLNNFKLERSAHPLLDEEALRVVKLMPNWKPGKQRGKAVRVAYTIPVKFKLEE